MSGASRTSAGRREAATARRAQRAAVTDPDTVMEAAATYLARRSRSVEETRRHLVGRGYQRALCDQAVERLAELGYLDDEALARAWVESRDRSRPRGARALRQELRRKGLADETITTVLAEREAAAPGPRDDHAPDDVDADRGAAERLLAQRATTLARESDPRRRRHKAYALLARHGFSPEVCAEVAAGMAPDPEDTIEPV